jgi:predicted ester cyclase
MDRRQLLCCGASAPLAAIALPVRADDACAANPAHAALLDRYAAALNAHDTTPFPELFTEGYIQNSGRSPSGLQAQVANFQRLFATMPDLRVRIDDRVIAGDKVVARTSYSATHTQPLRGIPPTGKPFTFHTIDIWRVEGGKFAEHWDLTDTAEVLNRLRE